MYSNTGLGLVTCSRGMLLDTLKSCAYAWGRKEEGRKRKRKRMTGRMEGGRRGREDVEGGRKERERGLMLGEERRRGGRGRG